MAKHNYSAEEVAEWRKAHHNPFYFNTDDSNLMVPKVYGFGRTFNWAHPISWVVIAAIAALIVYKFIIR